MNTLKKMIATVAVALTMAIGASATIIDLGITTGQPASQTDEFNRLTAQVNLWNTANDPDLPSPDASTYAFTQGNGTDTTVSLDLTDLSGYLMFKWGNNNQFYYVDGETLTSFNSTVFGPGRTRPPLGLSHSATWLTTTTTGGNGDPDPVPDAGSAMALLGIGMIGLASYRSKNIGK